MEYGPEMLFVLSRIALMFTVDSFPIKYLFSPDIGGFVDNVVFKDKAVLGHVSVRRAQVFTWEEI